MRADAMGITNQNSNTPDLPERVAAYVEEYLSEYGGLTLGELAFRVKADKRDLQRLLRDRSCGWRLKESLAAYFGDDFIEQVWRPVVGDGPSRRERELDRERAEIAARREKMERRRAEDRSFQSDRAGVLRLVPEQSGRGDV